ncbi:T9SS type A sorting domain-containing protein [Phaeodactylibacter luteus]|uniref:T9SS type A sorting domain-containing protein n=1 Tax=Phaeodactylibacter luteus TaxID=1564516 RepID=A0A5C6RIW6_9BACT|nr:T9SS type A sorting domain-containing protein [Phaeodactylibacter luteus]TXB61292.1 T9SS type A sorting domain-containing protein [Phaeodactylibacter luteus]
MLKKLPYLLTFALVLLAQSALFAQPANDECESAVPITSGTHEFTTVDATTGSTGAYPATCPPDGESTSDSLYNDVWFIYTADFTGTARFSTCGTADYDTNVAIYEGSSCPPSPDDIVTCNEDGVDDEGEGCANFTSIATFEVAQGETYLIQIGGWASESPGDEGSGTFSITEITPPSGPTNDECVDAIPLDLGEMDSVVIAFNNIEASTGLPQHAVPQSCFEEGEEFVYNDLWYSWTATFTGGLEFSTCNTASFDSRLAVYESSVCPPDTSALVGCGDDEFSEAGTPCGGFTSRALFNVEQGVDYLFRLGGWSSSSRGQGTFLVKRIDPVQPPVNDNCANALDAFIITQEAADNFDVIFEGTNQLASGQPQFPTPLCNDDGDFWDVWYSFNSGNNTDITLRFNKTSINAEFIVDLFTGCGSQADPVEGPYFCIETEDFNNTFLEVNLPNFPGEPTEYLLRIATRVTAGDMPGDFWFQLVGEPISSVEELPLSYFQLFPNPTQGLATLSFVTDVPLQLQGELANALGQTVKRLDFGSLPAGPQRLEVPTSGLRPGMYFLNLLSADGKRKAVRLMKQ